MRDRSPARRDLLVAYERSAPPHRAYVAPFDVHLPTDDVVQPDALLVLDARPAVARDGYHGTPALVVEILSRGHPLHDRVVKRDLYARSGVPEYWIVDPDERTVDVFRLEGVAYQPAGYLTAAEHEVASPTCPNLEVAWNDLFRRVRSGAPTERRTSGFPTGPTARRTCGACVASDRHRRRRSWTSDVVARGQRSEHGVGRRAGRRRLRGLLRTCCGQQRKRQQQDEASTLGPSPAVSGRLRGPFHAACAPGTRPRFPPRLARDQARPRAMYSCAPSGPGAFPEG